MNFNFLKTDREIVNINLQSVVDFKQVASFENELVVCFIYSKSEDDSYTRCGRFSVKKSSDDALFIIVDNEAGDFTVDERHGIYNLYHGLELSMEEYIQIELENSIESMVERKVSSERERLKHENASLQDCIKKAKEDLMSWVFKYNKNLCVLKSGLGNDIKEKLKDEMLKINRHKKCKSIKIDNNVFIFHTEYLYIREPLTEKIFDLGEMEVQLNFDTSCIRIYNKTRRVDAFWSNSSHPHVDGDGYPCLGNIDGQIASYLSDYEIYACFLLILGYLQSCDIEDCAGETVACWDEVDEDGCVINKAYGFRTLRRDGSYSENSSDDDDEGFTCAICGEWTDDDPLVCDICGNLVCEDCYSLVEGRVICDNCASERTTRCEECSKMIFNDHVTEIGGNNYCSNCAEHHTECIDCRGDINLEEDEFHQNEDGDFRCSDCFVEEDELVEDDREEECPCENWTKEEIEPEETPEEIRRCNLCGQLCSSENVHIREDGLTLCETCWNSLKDI